MALNHGHVGSISTRTAIVRVEVSAIATTTERGYGAPHQQERARWAPAVDAGRETCRETHCLYPSRVIHPGMKWELAHDHESPTTRYKGPAHQACNRMEELVRSGKVPAPKPRRLAL